MKNYPIDNDDFESFLTDVKSDFKPASGFKKELADKMKKKYEQTQWGMFLMDLFSSRLALGGLGGLLILVIIFTIYGKPGQIPDQIKPYLSSAKTDDWLYNPSDVKNDLFSYGIGGKSAPMMATQQGASMKTAAEANIGFSTGGAKDVNNFRENIKNGYLPLATDITYEGLYYDYFFDTGRKESCKELFCPSYSYAVSRDPYSKNNEYYMTVGLNSGVQEKDFARKKLNLLIVLDISGSMGSSFDRYYYDRINQVNPEVPEESNKSKMTIANEAVVALIDELRPDDRFGVVLFDDQAYEGKKLGPVSRMDVGAIKEHILEIRERGGTNHEAGFQMGQRFIKDSKYAADPGYENRIILITDAMPNTGSTDAGSLLGMIADAEADKIYTTFIGVGIDFNTELIEKISKVRGANYYSVHSSTEFKDRLSREFEYMVTPLVFDLSLNFLSEGWKIERVFGSPDTGETDRLMYVRTLFPSASEGGETKGGVVLLKLGKIGENNTIRLRTDYTDTSGKKHQSEKSVNLNENTIETYPNNGIRKAILLTRYANLMKYMIEVKKTSRVPQYFSDSLQKSGIPLVGDVKLGQWERVSTPLTLSTEDKVAISQFRDYFTEEANAIGDPTLNKEKELLELLSQ